MILGVQSRYMIVAPDGRVAVEDSGTIYLARFGEHYLTSKVKVYKDAKAAQKVIDKYDWVLNGCTVKPVTIKYEVNE